VRVACIDIGSNTTRLLIADRTAEGLSEVHQERAFTHIGAGLDQTGSIRREKLREVVTVVAWQAQVARDLGCAELRAVATAAIRDAANGAELADAIRAATDLQVEILSGEHEARLAFIGAAAMADQPAAGELGVIDVGGGSSELVVGTAPDRVDWWASIQLGSGTLCSRVLTDDPPRLDSLDAAKAEIAAALDGLEPPRPGRTFAVGGSATSLWRVAGPDLDATALARALDLLIKQPSAAIARRFAIDPQRARLLPAGLLILQECSRLLGGALEIGRGGIREGVLLEGAGR
jgi:exopolyphosphatase / guanosine-5'-triphosphate,3'-diphosphate pyrophosphatase